MALPSIVSRSNWNLEMLVFVEGGSPEYPEKNPPAFVFLNRVSRFST